MTTLGAVLLLASTLLSGCGSATTKDATTALGECGYSTSGEAAKPVKPPRAVPDEDAPTEVTISTSQGNIKVALDPDKAPCTVNSFLNLANAGYFDSTTCHRLVTSGIFILQCGDPIATGRGGPGYTYADELPADDPRLSDCQDQGNTTVCTYSAGTLAMANAGPDTNGSQFFLVYKDSPLPPAYTVFGRMSAGGLAVVRKIARAGNAADGVAPATTTQITSVK